MVPVDDGGSNWIFAIEISEDRVERLIDEFAWLKGKTKYAYIVPKSYQKFELITYNDLGVLFEFTDVSVVVSLIFEWASFARTESVSMIFSFASFFTKLQVLFWGKRGWKWGWLILTSLLT